MARSRKRRLVPLLLLLGMATPWPAQAMRCGTHLINPGDSAYRLQRLCGAPVDRVQYETLEYRWVRDTVHGGRALVPVTVTRERLTYDLGPTRFLRIVTLQAGVIIRIETGARPR